MQLKKICCQSSNHPRKRTKGEFKINSNLVIYDIKRSTGEQEWGWAAEDVSCSEPEAKRPKFKLSKEKNMNHIRCDTDLLQHPAALSRWDSTTWTSRLEDGCLRKVSTNLWQTLADICHFNLLYSAVVVSEGAGVLHNLKLYLRWVYQPVFSSIWRQCSETVTILL